MNTKQIIKKYEDIALSNKEILDLVDGKANVILYPAIHSYKNVDEMLNPYGACYILFESRPKFGHWCLLFKLNDHTLEFFNPYQGYPDDSLKFIPKDFQRKTYQNYPYLSCLLFNSPYQLTYNEFPFQKHANDIRTCGRWCAFRLICKNLSLYDFHDLVKNLCKKYKLTSDELVTFLTMSVNKISH